MFYATVENEDEYNKIIVDGKVFFCTKEETPRRRFSNPTNDPLFKEKNTCKELRMIKQFRMKYKNLDQIKDKYVEVIQNCMEILHREVEVEYKTMFEAFELEDLGITKEDYL